MAARQRIEIVRTVRDLRARIGDWRAAGLRVGLVPTMGSLHDGHLSLVRRSLDDNDRTCVTLFVNPSQFGPDEDLATYPRDEDADAGQLAGLGAALLYAPGVDEMYPDGFTAKVTVPGIGDRLEGAFRPGFFTGVATVVTKLLLQALPDTAYFGEKDFQQLRVIERLVADLDIPVAVAGCPTVREADGLALSSRNAYLDDVERRAAPTLYAALSTAAEHLSAGADVDAVTTEAERAVIAAGFSKVDYIAVCDSRTLEPLENVSGDKVSGRARILAAAWLGKARLIDNVAVG